MIRGRSRGCGPGCVLRLAVAAVAASRASSAVSDLDRRSLRSRRRTHGIMDSGNNWVCPTKWNGPENLPERHPKRTESEVRRRAEKCWNRGDRSTAPEDCGLRDKRGQMKKCEADSGTVEIKKTSDYVYRNLEKFRAVQQISLLRNSHQVLIEKYSLESRISYSYSLYLINAKKFR